MWGESAYRISHLAAMAPVAVNRGHIVDASGSPVPPELAECHGVRAFVESGETLLVGATHRIGFTWISALARGCWSVSRPEMRCAVVVFSLLGLSNAGIGWETL